MENAASRQKKTSQLNNYFRLLLWQLYLHWLADMLTNPRGFIFRWNKLEHHEDIWESYILQRQRRAEEGGGECMFVCVFVRQKGMCLFPCEWWGKGENNLEQEPKKHQIPCVKPSGWTESHDELWNMLASVRPAGKDKPSKQLKHPNKRI